MNRKNLNDLITEALAIEAEEAKRVGTLGFMARIMVQATLPHRKQEGMVFKRTNGDLSLTLIAHPDVGLPYGTIPRLLISWVTTEAIRIRNPVLVLGPTLSGFMQELGMKQSTGGQWGNIARLREQTKRLFSSSVSCTYDQPETGHWSELKFNIATETRLWWDPKQPKQAALWKSTVRLSRDFFNEIISRPVPIDMRALKALKKSPMALDIYCWLTHRMFYLGKPMEIPWSVLQMQFGADYANNEQGHRDFKRAFLRQLRAVHIVYPEAKVENGEHGLFLKPSKPHVAPMPPVLRNDTLQLPPIDQVTRLQTETFEKARKAAPGWDIYHLEGQWRDWIADKEKPKNPDAAFIAFCRKKHRREGMP
jgi:hypothetical protein